MILPKYNFYIGSAINVYFNSGMTIDSTGNIISGSSTQYASSTYDLYKNKYVYINLISLDYHNAIFFYDKSKNFISYKALDDNSNNTVIQVPSNAVYFALRFSTNDANFASKKSTNFVYTLSTVNPHYKELNKKYAKENEQQFFRTTLDGKITVFGQDYELVYNADIETQFTFVITKLNDDGVFEEYFKGEFNKTDCKFDFSKKSCELKLSALDEYSNIVDNYENNYDLIKLAPAISQIDIYKRCLIQVYIAGANTVSNFLGGTYWEVDVNEVVDNRNSLINNYHFAYLRTANEFYVENSSLSDINNVYAGINGDWQNWNGYSAYVFKGDHGYYRLAIRRNSDQKDIYRMPNSQALNINYDEAEITDTYLYSDIHYDDGYKLEAVAGNGIVPDNDVCYVKTIFEYGIYQRLLLDLPTITDSEGEKSTYNLPIDDFVSDNRNYKKCIGLVGGIVLCTSYTVDTPTRFGMNDYGRYFTNKFWYSSIGIIGKPLPISRNSWANASLWYVYSSWYSYVENSTRSEYALKNAYHIADVIKVLLKQIDPSIKHEATTEYSQFLYGTAPLSNMQRFYVYITPKSNILKGDYDQAAQKAEISFEDIMNMLRDCFRCYWYIEDGKLKIEHINFFINGGSYFSTANVQLDFTKLIDQFNRKLTSYFQSEIEYEKDDLSSRYEFSWMDDTTDLFEGAYIDIKSNYVQKDKSEEINVSQFTPDVDYMLTYPSEFSNDGFALLCPIKSETTLKLPIITTTLKDEDGDDYTVIVQNWYASWHYLINFYMYDMPAFNAVCNSVDIHVKDIIKSLKHEIQFPLNSDPNTVELIKTSLGNGVIDELSISIDTRMVSATLKYKPQ